MSTRSRIGIKRLDGSIKMIYCHSDGYFSWNGKFLFEHHNSLAHAEALVAEGDMSSLRETIGVKHDFDWRMNKEFENAKGHIDWEKVEADPRAKMCLFYTRDRGEKGCGAREYDDLSYAAEDFEEYLYLWDVARGAWIGCATPYQANPDILEWHLLSDIAAAGYENIRVAYYAEKYGEEEGQITVERTPYDAPDPKVVAMVEAEQSLEQQRAQAEVDRMDNMVRSLHQF